MAKQVYVVMGMTGEYSDSTEWPVKAFLSKAKAEQLVAWLDKWLLANNVHMNSESVDYWVRQSLRGKCELDPCFCADYTGTRYYVMAVHLEN